MLQQACKKFLEQKYGADVIITHFEEVSGGFLSKAYKVTTLIEDKENIFFIKEPTEHMLSHEKGENIFASFLTSHRTAEHAQSEPESVGCFITDKSTGKTLGITDTLGESHHIVEVQKYRKGTPYIEYLDKLSNQKELTTKDKAYMNRIVDKLYLVHSSPLEVTDSQRKKLYTRGLQEVLTHPELTISLLNENHHASNIFEGERKYEYIVEMLKVIDHLKVHNHRLSIIHGDFWPYNILIDDEDDAFFIDYSRITYGDPGHDVGNLYMYLQWLAIYKKNTIYADLAEYFLIRYSATGNDELVKQTSVGYIGFTGAACLVEDFYPDATHEMRKTFHTHLLKVLRQRSL